jgi:carbon starvation protein
MLMESLVAIVALIAAASLAQGDYFAINVSDAKFKTLGLEVDQLPLLAQQIGERLTARSGGAVSLAVGVSQIFARLPRLETLIAYWYHFAIMFEALFILTTVDSGTRVARFLVQESFGRISPRFARTHWLPGTLLSTAIVCAAWGYLVWTGSVQTLWPMLGLCNQTLACIALLTISVMLVNTGRARYVWVTLVPLLFVATVTQLAGVELIANLFIPKMIRGGDPVTGWLLTALAMLTMASFAWMLGAAAVRAKSVSSGMRRSAKME